MIWSPAKDELVRLKARRKGEVGRILIALVEPTPGWRRALVSWRDDYGAASGDQFVDIDKLEPVPKTEEPKPMHKITACYVRDIKRIREIALDLAGHESALLLISGQNAQGKTSLLDALTSALGGKDALPPDPVRRGAKDGEIRIDFDGGALVVRRVVKAGGESTLTVTQDGGAVRSPQAMLDKLVGARFLDPLVFLSKPAAEQRGMLLALIDKDGEIAELDRRREDVFRRRTDAGRDLKRAKGELDRLAPVKVGEPITADTLASAFAAAMDEGLRVESAQRDLDRARNEYKAAEADIARLSADLELAKERKAAATRDGNAAAAARKALPTADQVKAKVDAAKTALSTADQHNAKVAGERAAAERRALVEADVAREDGLVSALTDEIDGIDVVKASKLEAAALPVPGLGVAADELTLNGVSLHNASGAERLRVALALAVAAAPKLGDVWIRDGSLLDDQSLALVAEMAEAAGVRVWVERVGDRDPGAIVIHDGGLK